MPEPEKTEKITVNVGLVDLGEIDLLVSEGFYANRTDFIRSAIRRQLDGRASAVRDSVDRRTLALGTVRVTTADLQRHRSAGQTLAIRVLGLCVIDDDVDPALAASVISTVEVLGAFRAPRAVKAALAPVTV